LIGPASRPIAKTAVEGGLIAYREAEGLSRAATDDRSEQPRRETVPSCPGLSPLPRSVGLGRLCVDNNLLVAAVSLRPKPQEVPPPIPSRSALCFRSGPRLGLRADIIVLARHRTSAFGRKTGCPGSATSGAPPEQPSRPRRARPDGGAPGIRRPSGPSPPQCRRASRADGGGFHSCERWASKSTTAD